MNTRPVLFPIPQLGPTSHFFRSAPSLPLCPPDLPDTVSAHCVHSPPMCSSLCPIIWCLKARILHTPPCPAQGGMHSFSVTTCGNSQDQAWSIWLMSPACGFPLQIGESVQREPGPASPSLARKRQEMWVPLKEPGRHPGSTTVFPWVLETLW